MTRKLQYDRKENIKRLVHCIQLEWIEFCLKSNLYWEYNTAINDHKWLQLNEFL